MSAFYAAKAGIVAFSKALAREVGAYGTVNVVALGVIENPELALADARRRRGKGIAVRRLGTGADIANAVLFLVSEECEFVRGDVLGARPPEAGFSEAVSAAGRGIVDRPALTQVWRSPSRVRPTHV